MRDGPVPRKEITMSRNTFINLPVKDLARTTEFFTKVGFSFNQEFTDENATCMVISDETYAMLVVESFFKGFTQQEITDTSKSREVIVGLSAEGREEVDDRVDKALAAGGQTLGEAQDDGFMYMRGFRDLDGHQWSFIHMEMSAIPEQ
jgi:predicted lactoylglutathione lyase